MCLVGLAEYASETVSRLAGYKNISAIKEASGSVSQMMEIRRLCGDKIDLMSGEDGLIHPALPLAE